MATLEENINRVVADFDSIKSAIESRNIEVGNAKTSEYADMIRQIKDDSVLQALLNKSITEVTISGDTGSIGNYAFYACKNLSKVEILEGVTEICGDAFNECRELNKISFPSSLRNISGGATFAFCGFTEIVLPEGVQSLGNYTFRSCGNLTKVYLPSSLTSVGIRIFQYCIKITEIVLGDNFNCNLRGLIDSTNLTVQSMVNMFTALADRTGQDSYTLELGSTNLAKLTVEQKAIAINKNWILA